MTTTTFVIALISILAGYISNAVQSGSFLGITTIPKAWLPYATLIGTFLANFAQSAAQTSPVDWKAAVVAGFLALGGATVGITVHQHLLTGKKKPANDNGQANAQKAA
jgi:hypothetical protein